MTEEQFSPRISPSIEALLRKINDREINKSSKKLKQDTGLLQDQQISSQWLKEKTDKGIVRINNAYFQLGNNVSKSSLSTLGLINNKDSSRDSAYGFSSGESRITTRESTPEKVRASNQVKGIRSKNGSLEERKTTGKYKSSLSTVASSINQDGPQTHLPYSEDSTKKNNFPKVRTPRFVQLLLIFVYIFQAFSLL